jgi:hypothetical protein
MHLLRHDHPAPMLTRGSSHPRPFLRASPTYALKPKFFKVWLIKAQNSTPADCLQVLQTKILLQCLPISKKHCRFSFNLFNRFSCISLYPCFLHLSPQNAAFIEPLAWNEVIIATSNGSSELHLSDLRSHTHLSGPSNHTCA